MGPQSGEPRSGEAWARESYRRVLNAHPALRATSPLCGLSRCAGEGKRKKDKEEKEETGEGVKDNADVFFKP